MARSTTSFFRQAVTTDAVLQALRRFEREYAHSNDYEGWLNNPAYKYAIQHAGKSYPPKLILNWITGIDRDRFNGGEQTNRVFRQLGFEVTRKP